MKTPELSQHEWEQSGARQWLASLLYKAMRDAWQNAYIRFSPEPDALEMERLIGMYAAQNAGWVVHHVERFLRRYGESTLPSE